MKEDYMSKNYAHTIDYSDGWKTKTGNIGFKLTNDYLFRALLQRDEKTLKPVRYFFKAPKHLDEKECIIVDPMLATGGSGLDAIELLKEKGAKKIKFLSIISAPEGLKAISDKYPDVEIFTACIDEKLNENKYIVPGLGDAGDRIFGTK